MNLVFLEAPLFTRLLPDYMSDEDYQSLQLALMDDPMRGEVMPGTGGFRKLLLKRMIQAELVARRKT